MKIEVMVFKESGKFYSSEEFECSGELYFWEREFKVILLKALPAKIERSKVLVRNMNDDGKFMTHLFNIEDLIVEGRSNEGPYIKI